MANATASIDIDGFGPHNGTRFHVPVAANTAIYAGTMVAQLIASGYLVPATTAGAGPAIGKATHDVPSSASAGQRCLVETEREYGLTNGATTDAFSEASFVGQPVYALDDNSVADNDNGGTLQQCGTFRGMESDGRVRVFMSPEIARSGGQQIQAGTGTLVAGVLTVSAGITVTATSRVFAMRKTEGGTDGDELRCPTADRTVGGPGTGSITIRAFSAGSAATSDTSTIDYLIVG